ncbi:MAG: hypothetical protein WA782_04935 [Sulfitobacter sp.]
MRMVLSISAFVAALVMTSALPMTAQADGHSEVYAGSKGYVGEVTPRPAQQYQTNASTNGSQPKRVRSAIRYTVPGCPPKFNGMYRGTLYCVDGRPID